MDELHLLRRLQNSTGLLGLLLLGFDAPLVIMAVTRHAPVVLIPFASATLISCVAIWWAHHDDRTRTISAPFGVDKITPDSSDTRPVKAVD
jgi:hypothetical protein